MFDPEYWNWHFEFQNSALWFELSGPQNSRVPNFIQIVYIFTFLHFWSSTFYMFNIHVKLFNISALKNLSQFALSFLYKYTFNKIFS